jgi:flagellar biosynthesis protein FlhB
MYRPHCYVLLLSSIMWCLRCCLNDSLIIPVSPVPPKVQPISSLQFVLCCIVYLVKLFFSIMSQIFINYFILMYSWHMIVGLLDNNCNFLSTWFLISSKLMLCLVFPFIPIHVSFFPSCSFPRHVLVLERPWGWRVAQHHLVDHL